MVRRNPWPFGPWGGQRDGFSSWERYGVALHSKTTGVKRYGAVRMIFGSPLPSKLSAQNPREHKKAMEEANRNDDFGSPLPGKLSRQLSRDFSDMEINKKGMIFGSPLPGKLSTQISRELHRWR
ncbi:hypothetical protein NC652_014845 [Populus alba x Populus x berolinensis]|nr:hypothetical protein NC652_014845 [Populus alba x Populus x berolinensis]